MVRSEAIAFASPAVETKRINLKTCGSVLATRDQGEALRTQLLQLLQESGQVEIDFDGVEAYTPSFIDEFLGKSLTAIGSDRFRRDIKLCANSLQVRKLINLVLSNRAGARST
jgi:hypothetical protein